MLHRKRWEKDENAKFKPGEWLASAMQQYRKMNTSIVATWKKRVERVIKHEWRNKWKWLWRIFFCILKILIQIISK
jgi:hypothetical protein